MQQSRDCVCVCLSIPIDNTHETNGAKKKKRGSLRTVIIA